MPHRSVTGFTGKLPSRGDFVRAGLPRDFCDGWDAWWQAELPAVQALPDWVEAWLVAPVWRFHLPAGLCGAGAVLGAWLPSVDKAGRYFPLTVAAIGSTEALDGAGSFLDGAEAAALDALALDLEPDVLAARIEGSFGTGGPPPNAGTWWTEGGPRVPAGAQTHAGLPSGPAFAGMLGLG